MIEPWKEVGDGRWVGSDPSSRFTVYTRGNAGEVYPEVFTPMSFSIAAEAGEKAMRAAVLMTGLIRPEELDGVPLTTAAGTGVFGGYAYLNLSIARVASARVPGGSAEDTDKAFMGTSSDGSGPPPHVPHPDDKNFRAGLAGLRFTFRTIREGGEEFGKQLRQDQRLVDDYLAALPNLKQATDEELRAASTSSFIDMFSGLFERHLKVSQIAGLSLTILADICERQLDDESIATQLLAGIGDIDSAAPSTALWALGRQVRESAPLSVRFDQGIDDDLLSDLSGMGEDGERFALAFRGFIERFGSRGPNEWDTAFDTWETDPRLALTLVDRLRLSAEDHDPAPRQARLAADRTDLETEVMGRVRWPMRSILRRTLGTARTYSQHRERAKTTVIRAIHGARLTSMELDRRLVERAKAGGAAAAAKGDLWFLVVDELDEYMADPAGMANVIAERRAMHAELSSRIPPFVFEHSQPPLEEWELRSATRTSVVEGEVLAGLAGCLGVARGRARVVTDPADPRGLEPGDVLIAPLTDPSWTPLFLAAEAVVVDVGAVMSHAVIVSRELGIPCVVSATDATRRIPDGALVEVDGNQGTVTIIELPD